MHARRSLVFFLLLLPSPALPAEILRCLGPGDAVVFTNAACPEGFTIVGRMPARVPSGSEPCTDADALGPNEIDSALLDATARLRAARTDENGERRASWERCLGLLTARKAALERAAAPAVDETGARRPPEERVDEVCAVGSFQTQSQPGGFDVVYTNLSSRACRSVPYYCLWGVFSRAGFYQQSKSAIYRGRVEPNETLAIAAIEPQGGPPDREVVWSWCVRR